MRKAILPLIVMGLPGAFFFFNSCKREISPDSSSNHVTVAKVNAWLDQQKQGKLPDKIANLELLKNNLNFSSIRFERSDNGEQFLVVPIDEKFKEPAKIDKRPIMNLFLVINTSGDIRSGNIVLYTPAAGQPDKIPKNTFYNIFNTAQPDCNGKFQFLTVAGTPQYQLEYKDKHLISSGLYQSMANSSGTSRMVPVCYDVYLVTTFYDQDGTIISQTSQFLYTTCGDDSGGAGGGGETVNCCISDPTAQLTSRSVSQTNSDKCGLETTDKLTGLPMKTCTHSWYFTTNSIMWYTWKYGSVEQAIETKQGGVWKFKSVNHQGMFTNGTLPPCMNSSCTISSAIPLISESVARMNLIYTITFTYPCRISGGSQNKAESASSQWTAA